MQKKGFLLIDGDKNAVILNQDELDQCDLLKLILKTGISAKVRRHKTRAELNKSISEYLSGGWLENNVL